MKKLILYSFILSLIYINAFAQHNLRISAGVNYSTFDQLLWTSDESIQFRPGYFASIGYDLLTRQKHSLFLEASFNAKGNKSNVTNGNESELNLDYLSFSPVYSYQLIDRLNLYVGPEIGYLINSRLKLNNQNIDLKPNFRNYDISLNLGTHLYLSDRIFLDLRWTEGLIGQQNAVGDVTNYSDGNQNWQGKNRSFKAGIGLTF